jgi:hypothetical protein
MLDGMGPRRLIVFFVASIAKLKKKGRGSSLQEVLTYYAEPLSDATAEKENRKVGKKKGSERGTWDLCLMLSAV